MHIHFTQQVLNPRASSGNFSASTVGAEMAHQLYVLQSLLFNLHDERMSAVPSQGNEIETEKKISELRKFAFDDNELVAGDASNGSKGDLPFDIL